MNISVKLGTVEDLCSQDVEHLKVYLLNYGPTNNISYFDPPSQITHSKEFGLLYFCVIV